MHACMHTIWYQKIKRFKNVSGSTVKAIYATTCIDELIIKTVAFYWKYHRYDTASESKTLFRE
jgi:hypothetical protein